LRILRESLVTSQAVYEVRKSVVQRTNICIYSTSSIREARGANALLALLGEQGSNALPTLLEEQKEH